MQRNHRTSIIVTSCLKTPVDPHTKAPVALYERERALPCVTRREMDNRDYEKEMEDNSESDGQDGSPEKGSPVLIKDYRVTGDHIDLREFYFSNEEYYRKLEQLKKAHLHTMAQLEQMYRKKLELKGTSGSEDETDQAQRMPWGRSSLAPSASRLKKSRSAHELGRASVVSDESEEEEEDEEDDDDDRTEKGLLLSPKERIKNMWQDFSVERFPHSHQYRHRDSFSSLVEVRHHRGPARGKVKGRRRARKTSEKKKRKEEAGDDGDGGVGGDGWRPRVTVPQPFSMTLREASRKRDGTKTRTEVERENAELRRQLEELSECQRQFRASPVPAHVRQPLYDEMRRRDEERRRAKAEEARRRGAGTAAAGQRPFSFLERERLKREQREEQLRRQAQEEADAGRKMTTFRAKPVPRAVREVAEANERLKEQQLYRAIKMQIRARDLLHSASMPPSMLARRLEERKEKEKKAAKEEDGRASHRPQINGEVPDFDSSYRRFQKQLERGKREGKPLTACEPFQLRTANIPSRRERVGADIAVSKSSPRDYRWPFQSSPLPSPRSRHTARTSSSSLCSSLSGSQEVLTAKITDASRKRQEAIRKVLEQKQKAEEEGKKWRERQRQRERSLQKVISRRAQANDPHQTLAQTCQSKLKEFRKQDLKRRREYMEEMKEIEERVRDRPLLLEQVARNNAKQVAERRYAEVLKACGLSEDFVREKALRNRRSRSESPSVRPGQRDVRRRNQDAPLSDSVSMDGSLHDYKDDYEDYCDQDHEGEEEEEDRKGEEDQYESDDEDESNPERRDSDNLSNDDEQDYSKDDREESDKGSDIINRDKDS